MFTQDMVLVKRMFFLRGLLAGLFSFGSVTAFAEAVSTAEQSPATASMQANDKLQKTSYLLDPKLRYNPTIPYTKIKPTAVIKRADKLISRRLCVWDPMGQTGEITNTMKDYLVMAETQGVQLELKAYIEEKIAIEDFRVGYCDAVLVTGLRIRPYNSFTGSIEAVQGLPDKNHMRMLIEILSKPSAAKYMITKRGEATYEVAGIMPFGSVFGFVKDRSITTVDKLTGKRIAIFDYDKAEAKLVSALAAKSEPSDVTNFADKFNNGQVDIVFAPVMAYKALELYKGLGKNGGIVNYVLAQVSLQVLIHPDRFPEDYGQTSRDYVLGHFDRYQKLIDGYEKEISPKVWVPVKDSDRPHFEEIGRNARIQMVREGIYDGGMMTLMRKIRCLKSPTHSECALGPEQ